MTRRPASLRPTRTAHMTSARHYGLATLALLACAATSHAQLPQAKLFAIFPPGAQTRTTLEVTVDTGEDIDELSKHPFTHPGITAVQKSQDVPGVQQPIDNVFVFTVAADVPPGVYEAAAEVRFGST